MKCAGATPYPGNEILDGGTCVGHTTTGAWSPFLDTGIGYVRFNEAGDWVGKTLSLKSAEGDAVHCEIVTLPFYDAEKRIPRGLDKTIP